MKNSYFNLIISGIVFGFSVFSLSQTQDPELILNRVQKNFDLIKDYQVDVDIKVDVNFIKVPETHAKIYFKQPHKIHFESEGFAMLPKEGLNFSPSALLSQKHTSIFEKKDTIDGIAASVIKIIPLNDSGDVILSTVWIDIERDFIRRIETTTKTNGTFAINLYYDKNSKYSVPEKMVFSFNLAKMDLPKGMGGDLPDENDDKNLSPTTEGKVIISYSNYVINKGIDDSIFKEDEK